MQTPTRLREARLRAGWPMCRLARDAGINYSRLSLYENGWQRPCEVTLGKLAGALGCSPDDIRETGGKGA
jgi:transcriptional regulator with XRE-family HTH domain